MFFLQVELFLNKYIQIGLYLYTRFPLIQVEYWNQFLNKNENKE